MRVAAGEPPVAPVPATTQHAKGISMDEVFEQRWRKAYEVRALERESRQGQSQVSSRSSSADASSDTAAKPQYGHAVGTVDLQAAAGGAAADALVSRLSLHSAGTAEDGAEASAGGVPAEVQRGRPQEISDDDEEEDGPQSERAVGSAVATEAAAAAVHPAQQRTEGVFEREEEEEEEEEEGEECRVVWDSSQQRQGAASAPPLAAGEAEAAGGADARALKERGNTCLKAGDNEGALLLYSQALEACRAHLAQARQGQKPAAGAEQGTAPHAGHEALASAGRRLLATLHSNRAHALLRLRRGEEAAVEAEQAHQLHPTWPKPLYRLAQAHLALGRWAAAVAACRAGEALARRSADGSTEFTPLMDDIAVAAARAGSTAGYDGDQLEVRYAGPEAWLCRPAPHVPELDGQEDTDGQGVVTHLPPRSHGGALARGGSAPASALAAPGTAAGAGAAAAVGGGDPLVAWSYGRSVAAARGPRRTSFRSIKEAVEAARDGDRIVLRRGQHNGMGETVTLSKRLLIEGEGQPGETFIDQRANNPTFRILRGGVVLRNVVIDQSGFREALLVSGPPGSRPAPLIDGCVVKCSGDDAVNVAGEFESKKCGVKAFGSSAPRFERCAFAKCGEQGLRAQEAAEPVLLGCAVSECGEEAVVGCDAARLTLTACELSQCKGPALDLSGGAAAAVQGSSFHGCVGGVFLWDAASASLKETQVEGGKAHVILADGASTVIVRGSTLRGTVHAADAAWQGILHPSNRLLDPELPADFPRDQGPFRFTPDPYKRKQ